RSACSRSGSVGMGGTGRTSATYAPLSSLQVLDIFRQKTAPAFEVALLTGALMAGEVDEELRQTLAKYSEAVGIAYQIRDDLHDLAGDAGNICGARPSLPLAVGLERGRAHDEHAAVLAPAWTRQADTPEARDTILGDWPR
nr:polyprenyl synthetase family protein [Acidobacteriota bacterium]